MKSEKRTKTVLGLGKAQGETHGTKTSTRGRPRVEPPVPVEDPTPVTRGDSAAPQSRPIERIERIERTDAGESSPPAEERIEHLVDRSDGSDKKNVRTADARFDSEERKRAALDGARPPSGSGSRTVDGKPIGRVPSGRPLGRSAPPATTAPATPSGRPADRTSASPWPGADQVDGRPPAPAPQGARVARSARPSIREDNVGSAADRASDSAALAGRVVPRLLKTKAEIAAAPIDHRAGFLLAYIDGVTSVQGLVDIAAMPHQEVHEILERLRRLGIVAVR